MVKPEAESNDYPNRWNTTNLVGLPAGLIASVEFNAHPQTLRIAGAQETHRGLFRLLDESTSHEDAAEKFRRYMDIVFHLKATEYEITHAKKRRFRPSYLKLMQGWGFDSNSPQGAVLKGWVESRFGLTPTYHKAPLQQFPSKAWIEYLEEKYTSRFHNNSIHMQLDLLYEYCQFVLNRFGSVLTHANHDWVTLWRGINLYEEPTLQSGLKNGECVLQLNNLVSFTTSRERAEEFGDWILETQVPKVKLLFFPGLLLNHPLSGEGEVLALGGNYKLKASYV
jgi:NAD+---dinitrogen-reductase ADP-D-ribosyltransferase